MLGTQIPNKVKLRKNYRPEYMKSITPVQLPAASEPMRSGGGSNPESIVKKANR